MIPPQTSHPNRFLQSFLTWWSTARTSLLWMVALAFTLRLALILIGRTYNFKPAEYNFNFGYEMGSIGRSLASGHGYGNPFGAMTGPTAWEPPLYPFLIATIFRVLGIFTPASAIALLSINSLFSALTCIPIFKIAKRCFREIVAIWSAWIWALLPSVMFWGTRWVWETSLAALFLTTLFWLVLTMEDREGRWPWAGFGLLWGMAALTNTSLLAFLPASGLWIWYRRAQRNQRSIAGIALASLLFLACITPWLIRDYQTLGKFIFIRDNFGAELAIGNGPGADGTWRVYLHPTQNTYEMRRYQQLGELAYVDYCKRKALTFIRENPGQFAIISLKRFIYYWGGVPRLAENPALAPFKNSLFLATSVLAFLGLVRALRKRIPGAWLFFWLIVSYPTIYYFVFPHPRYRHPIEPELAMLIVYIVSEAKAKN